MLARFGSIQYAPDFVVDFIAWYNHEHLHGGLAMFTPCDVHHGLAEEKIELRAAALREAYAQHPERFPHGAPTVRRPPKEVWINKPTHEPNAHAQPTPVVH